MPKDKDKGKKFKIKEDRNNKRQRCETNAELEKIEYIAKNG